MCSDYNKTENEAGDDSVSVYVTPGLPPRPVATFVLATGSSESDLFALGPTNAPVPTRCCAICDGNAYEGVAHTLSYNVDGSSPIPACESFSLHYWNDGVLASWYCTFHVSTTSSPVLLDPANPEPVHHYIHA